MIFIGHFIEAFIALVRRRKNVIKGRFQIGIGGVYKGDGSGLKGIVTVQPETRKKAGIDFQYGQALVSLCGPLMSSVLISTDCRGFVFPSFSMDFSLLDTDF